MIADIRCAVAMVGTAAALVGCATSQSVRVRNDNSFAVRIAACVDDAQDLRPGETFDAQGVPDHGTLACSVTRLGGVERCVGIPHADAVQGTIELSRTIALPHGRCV
jgi:hypothetical protein